MKSISPVIATVIIVAVAIAISIAVALWLTGIVGGFTTVENLQIIHAYPEYVKNLNETKYGNFAINASGWIITLKIENKGTAAATIDMVFVNGKPLNITGEATMNLTGTKSVNAGEQSTIIIALRQDPYRSGQQVEIKIHTASGKEYPKMITLP